MLATIQLLTSLIWACNIQMKVKDKAWTLVTVDIDFSTARLFPLFSNSKHLVRHHWPATPTRWSVWRRCAGGSGDYGQKQKAICRIQKNTGKRSGTTSHGIWPVAMCSETSAPITSKADAATQQAKSVRPTVRTKNEQATAIIHEVARSPGHDAALLWAGIQGRVASIGVSAPCRLMMGRLELEGWNAEGQAIGCVLARVAVGRPSGFHSGLWSLDGVQSFCILY
jgi:hypothetical protein